MTSARPKYQPGLSDTSLFVLWRKAVFRRRGYRCAICGGTFGLEVHHIVKRRVKLLRWDSRNGLPVCRSCHDRHADLVAPTLISAEDLTYLRLMQRQTFKAYLLAEGLSEQEWRGRVKATLIAELARREVAHG